MAVMELRPAARLPATVVPFVPAPAGLRERLERAMRWGRGRGAVG
jgi:hypothetical protein